jgi:hypothetical protein
LNIYILEVSSFSRWVNVPPILSKFIKFSSKNGESLMKKQWKGNYSIEYFKTKLSKCLLIQKKRLAKVATEESPGGLMFFECPLFYKTIVSKKFKNISRGHLTSILSGT